MAKQKEIKFRERGNVQEGFQIFQAQSLACWGIPLSGLGMVERTALIGLEIRQDFRVKSPCLATKSAQIRHSANFQTRPKQICACRSLCEPLQNPD